MGGTRGNGRKRHVLVDTTGVLLRVLVHPADISAREGAERLLLDHHAAFPRLECIRADQGYKACLAEWMRTHTNIGREAIEKPAGQKGCAVIPKRLVVERTLAWRARNRRLGKDYERRPECSESVIYLSSIHLMLKRLTPAA